MAKAPGEIKINLTAEGAAAVTAAIKGVENAGRRTGTVLEKAGKDGSKSFTLVRGAATGLNGILNTTANLSTGLFTGILAGGMALGGAFNVAKAGVGGLKSSLDTLRDASIEAANEVRNLEMLAAALQIDGSGAAALTQGITSAISAFSFDAEAGDIADMLNDLSTKALEALKGEEEAAKIFTDLGISVDDLISKSGKLKAPVDILYEMVDAASQVDKAIRNNALERIIGTGGVRQFAPLFGATSQEIRDTAAEMMKLGNVSDDVVASAERVAKSQQRVSLALSGVGNSLLSGMSGSITEGNEAFTDFLVKNQGKVEEFGRLIGGFSDQIYSRLMAFADAASSDLSGVGGDLAGGPLKTGLDAIIQAIDFLLDRLEEVTAYVGQGQSVEWIDSIVSGLKTALETAKSFSGDLASFFGFIRDDVAPAIQSFMSAISGIYDALGVESTGAQLGISLAILSFGSTIISVTALIGGMIAKVTGLTGAITASTTAVGGALAALGPAVAIVGAAAVGGVVGANEGEALRSYERLYSAVPTLAEKYGEEAAAAFALAGEQTLANNNESWAAWLTGKLGLTDSKEDRIIDLQARLSDSSKDDVLRDLAGLARSEGVKVLDDLEFDIGAGITITGAEINAEIQSQLASIPATIEITAIEGLQERIDQALSGSSRLASSADVGGIATTGGLTPTTINFNGQPVGQVYAKQDQIAEMRRAQARVNRGQ